MSSSEHVIINALDYADIENYAKVVASKLSAANFKPDLIIGVARGGSIPAAMLAYELKKWFHHPAWQIATVFASSYEGQDKLRRLALDITGSVRALMHAHQRVLIVDDIYDSGDTIGAINYQLRETRTRTDVRIATLLTKDPEGPDFYGHLIDESQHAHWVQFPWESPTPVTDAGNYVEGVQGLKLPAGQRGNIHTCYSSTADMTPEGIADWNKRMAEERANNDAQEALANTIAKVLSSELYFPLSTPSMTPGEIAEGMQMLDDHLRKGLADGSIASKTWAELCQEARDHMSGNKKD